MKPPLSGARQRNGVSCGPAVAVIACSMLDTGYRAPRADADTTAAWFSQEQVRVHRWMNRIWPRMLGTTPMGMAAAISRHAGGTGYRWRMRRGRCDDLADVLAAARVGWPVAVLIGRVLPRHWVLVIDARADEAEVRCYEPSSGAVRAVAVDALRRARLTGLGYPRPLAFVLPASAPGVAAG